MDRTERRLVTWWAILAAVTLVSWETGRVASGSIARASVVAVLALAFGKAIIVMLQFMDVRIAPWPLKLALWGWSVTLAITIASLWLFA